MKNIYLTKSEFSSLYVFYELDTNGGWHNRQEFNDEGNSGLVKRILEFVPINRKAIFHLVNLPDELALDLAEKYEESKVKVLFD